MAGNKNSTIASWFLPPLSTLYSLCRYLIASGFIDFTQTLFWLVTQSSLTGTRDEILITSAWEARLWTSKRKTFNVILPGNLCFQYILELSDKIKQFSAIGFFWKSTDFIRKCLRAGLSIRGQVIKVYFSKQGFIFYGIRNTLLNESEIIYHYLSLVRRNDNAYFSFNWKSLSSNTNTFTLNTVRRRYEKKRYMGNSDYS